MANKLLLLLLILFFNILSLKAQNAEDIANIGLENTVGLIMNDRSGNPSSIGSGFFIKPNEIITNYHVIENSSGGNVKFPNRDNLYRILGIVAYDQDKDLAIIRVSVRNNSVLSFAEYENLRIGQNVYTVGAPRGLDGTFSNGIISGFRNIEGTNLIQITAPISPGSSGGPVLDSTGKVIGVAVGGFSDSQNLNFAVSVEELQELMQSTNELISFSQFLSQTQRQNQVTERTTRQREVSTEPQRTDRPQQNRPVFQPRPRNFHYLGLSFYKEKNWGDVISASYDHVNNQDFVSFEVGYAEYQNHQLGLVKLRYGKRLSFINNIRPNILVGLHSNIVPEATDPSFFGLAAGVGINYFNNHFLIRVEYILNTFRSLENSNNLGVSIGVKL